MIICPSCKEEIDDDSHFCDQCGQELVYCSNCERVGMGRRCTHCGGLMVSYEELMEMRRSANKQPVSLSSPQITNVTSLRGDVQPVPQNNGIPTLTLYNPNLDIRITGINGAIIGRRQGPYQNLFEGNMYISGAHAQLIYKSDSGWCIIDKNSSNGTKLNQRDLQPDIPMSIKTGDIVTLANINLQVSIN